MAHSVDTERTNTAPAISGDDHPEGRELPQDGVSQLAQGAQRAGQQAKDAAASLASQPTEKLGSGRTARWMWVQISSPRWRNQSGLPQIPSARTYLNLQIWPTERRTVSRIFRSRCAGSRPSSWLPDYQISRAAGRQLSWLQQRRAGFCSSAFSVSLRPTGLKARRRIIPTFCIRRARPPERAETVIERNKLPRAGHPTWHRKRRLSRH